jgi:hypothetical protein
MDNQLAVVIADAFRLRMIRLAAAVAPRVLYFTDTNLGAALESIRGLEPRVVALESQFAHTVEGRAFIDRLQSQTTFASEIHLLAFAHGEWSTSRPCVTQALGAATTANINTRRAPRFLLRNPLTMKVDGTMTNLVNMSVMGAQVISGPWLAPNQRLKIVLPDEEASVLRVVAQVAWSSFERSPTMPQPFYRAGMEFTDASATVLEDYCKRHCGDEPLTQYL